MKKTRRKGDPGPSETSSRPEATALRSFGRSQLAEALKPWWARWNSSKVWFTLGALSLALTWTGYRFGDRYGLLVGFFSALGLTALVFFFDDWRLAGQFRVVELEGRDAYGLSSTLRDLTRNLKLPKPSLLEIHSPTPFIFSAGLFPRTLKVFVSTSLGKKFTANEIRLLMAAELIKLQSGQTRTLTAAVAFADLWLLIMSALDAAFLIRLFRRRKPMRCALGPFTWMSRPPVAWFLRLVIRRSCYFEIDRQTVESFGQDLIYAQALAKLDAYNKALPLDVNLAEAALFPVSPLSAYTWASWASVQPPIEERIRALAGRYPL